MSKIKTILFAGAIVVGSFLGFYEYAKDYEKRHGNKNIKR